LRVFEDSLLDIDVYKLTWVLRKIEFPFVVWDLFGIVLEVIEQLVDFSSLNGLKLIKDFLVVVQVGNTSGSLLY
jgi:hypothetical protein